MNGKIDPKILNCFNSFILYRNELLAHHGVEFFINENQQLEVSKYAKNQKLTYLLLEAAREAIQEIDQCQEIEAKVKTIQINTDDEQLNLKNIMQLSIYLPFLNSLSIKSNGLIDQIYLKLGFDPKNPQNHLKCATEDASGIANTFNLDNIIYEIVKNYDEKTAGFRFAKRRAAQMAILRQALKIEHPADKMAIVLGVWKSLKSETGHKPEIKRWALGSNLERRIDNAFKSVNVDLNQYHSVSQRSKNIILKYDQYPNLEMKQLLKHIFPNPKQYIMHSLEKFYSDRKNTRANFIMQFFGYENEEKDLKLAVVLLKAFKYSQKESEIFSTLRRQGVVIIGQKVLINKNCEIRYIKSSMLCEIIREIDALNPESNSHIPRVRAG